MICISKLNVLFIAILYYPIFCLPLALLLLLYYYYCDCLNHVKPLETSLYFKVCFTNKIHYYYYYYLHKLKENLGIFFYLGPIF